MLVPASRLATRLVMASLIAAPASASTTCFNPLTQGFDYAGTEATTVSGRACQAWTEQTPQTHRFATSLGDQSNYCRNPDGEAGPWCYTTDSEKRWELCDVPRCDMPPSPPTGNALGCYTGTGYNLKDYSGTWATTETGYKCRPWSQAPYEGYKVLPENFCRNSDGNARPWCYSENPAERWEWCDIPACVSPPSPPAMPDGTTLLGECNPQVVAYNGFVLMGLCPTGFFFVATTSRGYPSGYAPDVYPDERRATQYPNGYGYTRDYICYGWALETDMYNYRFADGTPWPNMKKGFVPTGGVPLLTGGTYKTCGWNSGSLTTTNAVPCGSYGCDCPPAPPSPPPAPPSPPPLLPPPPSPPSPPSPPPTLWCTNGEGEDGITGKPPPKETPCYFPFKMGCFGAGGQYGDCTPTEYTQGCAPDVGGAAGHRPLGWCGTSSEVMPAEHTEYTQHEVYLEYMKPGGKRFSLFPYIGGSVSWGYCKLCDLQPAWSPSMPPPPSPPPAPPLPPPPPDGYAEFHSMHRCKHCDTEPLTKEVGLEEDAVAWAATCPTDHGTGPEFGNVNYPCASPDGLTDCSGENLFWKGFDPSIDTMALDDTALLQEAIDAWYEEVQNYNYLTGSQRSLSANPNPVHGNQIGHFTQVVWDDTRLVGCAVKKDCDNKWDGYINVVVVCRYYSSGNINQPTGNTIHVMPSVSDSSYPCQAAATCPASYVPPKESPAPGGGMAGIGEMWGGDGLGGFTASPSPVPLPSDYFNTGKELKDKKDDKSNGDAKVPAGMWVAFGILSALVVALAGVVAYQHSKLRVKKDVSNIHDVAVKTPPLEQEHC